MLTSKGLNSEIYIFRDNFDMCIQIFLPTIATNKIKKANVFSHRQPDEVQKTSYMTRYSERYHRTLATCYWFRINTIQT